MTLSHTRDTQYNQKSCDPRHDDLLYHRLTTFAKKFLGPFPGNVGDGRRDRFLCRPLIPQGGEERCGDEVDLVNRMTGDENDPYGAISYWYNEAKRDPDLFLKLFEGVVPKVRGMDWSPALGWLCAPSSFPTNMAYDTAPFSSDADPWVYTYEAGPKESRGTGRNFYGSHSVPTNMVYDPPQPKE